MYGCEGCPGLKFSSALEMLQHGHDAHGYPQPSIQCECSEEEGFLCPTHAVLDNKSEEIRLLKLQNDELTKAVGSAIQYVEHSRIGHPNSGEPMYELQFDPTCFKCTLLKLYFKATDKERQTEKRVEGS